MWVGWHSTRKAFRWKTGWVFTIIVSSPRKCLQKLQNLRINVPLLYDSQNFNDFTLFAVKTVFRTVKWVKKRFVKVLLAIFTPLLKSSPWPKCFCRKANLGGAIRLFFEFLSLKLFKAKSERRSVIKNSSWDPEQVNGCGARGERSADTVTKCRLLKN